MATNEYPTKIYGKTWILWACTLIIGQVACMGCILGPLFWLDILKRADGQPGSFGGIHMTVIGLLLMPVAILFAFQLLARQWPIIKIYKEGLEIREIGTPIQIDPILSIIGIGFIIIILVAIWQLITLQIFRTKTSRLRWDEIPYIMKDTGSFTIAVSSSSETKETFDESGHSPTVHYSYGPDSFSLPTEKVDEIVRHYRYTPGARESLPGWDDDFSIYRSFE